MGNSALNQGLSQSVVSVETRLDTESVNRLSSDQSIYLSPTGSDSTGDGTSANPYATLTKAFNSIKGKRIDSGNTLEIILKNGTYIVDDNFGPSHLNLSDMSDGSLLEDTGNTGCCLCELSLNVHPDMDRITIRGESTYENRLNDINGQYLLDDDGATCSYNHVVGITTAAPSGATACEDDFNFSLSLDLQGGSSLTVATDGITAGDHLFVRPGRGSTRMDRMLTTGTEWNGPGFAFMKKTNGVVTGGSFENKTNLSNTYKNYYESGATAYRSIDSLRQLTRYVVLGAHEVTESNGLLRTGTGPGDQAGNHAINTTSRKYIIDDKNFCAIDDGQNEWIINRNFYPDNWNCITNGFRPHEMVNGTLQYDDTVDYGTQRANIYWYKGKGSLVWPNEFDVQGATTLGAFTGGQIFDGTTTGVRYQHGVSAGGKWGANTRFTLDPASPNLNVGLTGVNGEYYKDNIRTVKYGAVLKVLTTEDSAADERLSARRVMFSVVGCSPTIKDLAIVGDYKMTNAHTDHGGVTGFNSYGVESKQDANPTVINIGMKNLSYPITCYNAKMNIKEVTADTFARGINCVNGDIRIEDSVLSSCWGSYAHYFEKSKLDALRTHLLANKGTVIYGSVESEINLDYCLVLWNGQGGTITSSTIVEHTSFMENNRSGTGENTSRNLGHGRVGDPRYNVYGTTRYTENDMITLDRDSDLSVSHCMLHGGNCYRIIRADGGHIDLHSSVLMNSHDCVELFKNSTVNSKRTIFWNAYRRWIRLHNFCSANHQNDLFAHAGTHQPWDYYGGWHVDDSSNLSVEACVADLRYGTTRYCSLGCGRNMGRMVAAFRGSHCHVRSFGSYEAREMTTFHEQAGGRYMNTTYQRSDFSNNPRASWLDQFGLSNAAYHVNTDQGRSAVGDQTPVQQLRVVFGHAYSEYNGASNTNSNFPRKGIYFNTSSFGNSIDGGSYNDGLSNNPDGDGT